VKKIQRTVAERQWENDSGRTKMEGDWDSEDHIAAKKSIHTGNFELAYRVENAMQN
jgi:hypothetical protein